MHPDGYEVADAHLNLGEGVTLITRRSKVEADILSCIYQGHAGRNARRTHLYARGPYGGYYEMNPPRRRNGYYTIQRRIWIPYYDYERTFYDYYECKTSTIIF